MVMAVSLVSSGRRALVSAVSRGQCECVVMALNVLISRSCRAGREKVRPACPKRQKNAVFRRVGRTFRGMPLEGPRWANFFAPTDIVPGLVGDAAPSKPEVAGVLHYMKPPHGVSPACRTPM